jgi:beta-xylosidase
MTEHPTTQPWHDTTRTAEERARLLRDAMTVHERVQQLVSTWPDAEGASGEVAPMQDSQDQALPFEEAIVDGIGQLTRPFGTNPIDPVAGVRRLAELQRAVMGANRFGIPALAHEECLTGFTAWKATVYPTPMASASTFDPDLIERVGAAIGRDLASVGIHQGLAPVLDVVRDYRWGRVEETLGEDPYVVGNMGAAFVRGMQSSGVVATLKHFAGYSASRGARNHAPVSMGRRELEEMILPPFEQAVVHAGARSVMNAYTETDGVPAAADHWLLSEVLRERWGFTGTVVSDYWTVPFLTSMHRIATDDAMAGRAALAAGIDVELPHALGFGDWLAEDPEELNTAVLRVLTQKAELGLLDAGWQPIESEQVDLDQPGNRALARRVAEESVVLLRNDEQVLPVLEQPPRIALIGPGADDPHCLFGCYSFPNHVLPAYPDHELGVAAPTIRDALVSEFPDSEVHYERGASMFDDAADRLEAAARLASASDITVLVVGDRSGMFGHGTSGEGCDTVDLRLPGGQEALVDAVLETGSRVILVVLSGRPYAIGRHAARAAAALQVFFPGQEGAGAITGVLSGRVAPSGRLPVQIPGEHAPQPGTYLAPPLGQRSDGVSNVDPTPAFGFGHGLSTTSISFEAATASSSSLRTDGAVSVSVVVSNDGDRAGWAVPQLYLAARSTSVTRPVRQLVGFCRVELQPGASRTVEFRVHADQTGWVDRSGVRRVSSGPIELIVAASVTEPGSAVSIDLVGEERVLSRARVMTAEASVR